MDLKTLLEAQYDHQLKNIWLVAIDWPSEDYDGAYGVVGPFRGESEAKEFARTIETLTGHGNTAWVNTTVLNPETPESVLQYVESGNWPGANIG